MAGCGSVSGTSNHPPSPGAPLKPATNANKLQQQPTRILRGVYLFDDEHQSRKNQAASLTISTEF